MEWIVFALLAPGFWAMNSITTKVLIDKKFQKPIPFMIFLLLIDMFFAFGVFLLLPITFVYPYSIYAMLTGALGMTASLFYLKALRMEEASRISSLIQMSPIFIAILSSIFLGEVLALQQYFGIVLIVVASMLISYRRVKAGRRLSPALKFMLVFALGVAAYNIFTKYVMNYISYWMFFFWDVMGFISTTPVLLLIPKVRKDFLKIISSLDKKTIAGGVLNESLWFLGSVSMLVAISLSYVSIVSSIGALQPLFALAYTILLSLFIPSILKEEITRFNVAQKLFAVLLIFVGIWMLNVF